MSHLSIYWTSDVYQIYDKIKKLFFFYGFKFDLSECITKSKLQSKLTVVLAFYDILIYYLLVDESNQQI